MHESSSRQSTASTTTLNESNSGVVNPAPSRTEATPVSLPILVSKNTSKSKKRKSPPQDDRLPLGPRHLEHAYALAVAELRKQIITISLAIGYVPRRRGFKGRKAKNIPTKMMVLDYGGQALQEALARVDEIDLALDEAIARGERWEGDSLSTLLDPEDVKPTPPPRRSQRTRKAAQLQDEGLLEKPHKRARSEVGT